MLDELKRVSTERDTLKQKLNVAEQNIKEPWDEVSNICKLRDINDRSDKLITESSGTHPEAATPLQIDAEDPLKASNSSPPSSVKSPPISTRGVSLFSPKSKQDGSQKFSRGSEYLLSYDDEIPRLETELQHRQRRINSLEVDVKSLKGDLIVTRESTQSMVQTLEEATREMNILRDSRDRSDYDLRQQKLASQTLSGQLRADLETAEDKLQGLQAENASCESERNIALDAQLQATWEELANMQSTATRDSEANSRVEELRASLATSEEEIANLRASNEQNEMKIKTLNGIVATLRFPLIETEEGNRDTSMMIEDSSKAPKAIQNYTDRLEANSINLVSERPNVQPIFKNEKVSTESLQSNKAEFVCTQEAPNTSKKKSKKKKRTGKPLVGQEPRSDLASQGELVFQAIDIGNLHEPDITSNSQAELRHVQTLPDMRETAIERLHAKLRDQDGLCEEIDTLREDLVNVGQEHVEAKDMIKALAAEKVALEASISNLQNEVAGLQETQTSQRSGSEQRYSDLAERFGNLKVETTTLQTDLSAAQQLAASRFKDLNDLRNILQKAQPEINVLRTEAAEVKSVKEAITKRDAEFKRLESQYEEMLSEVTILDKTIKDQELETKSLRSKLDQEISNRLKAENASSKSSHEFQRTDIEKRRVTESLDRISNELKWAREELELSKARQREIEPQLSKSRAIAESLQEEIELKIAQYASAQSLMAGMRDQTSEMAMQMKEARDRCDSLDEEVVEAHRLLGERTREGETMRKLMADIQGRTDARTREMKERMDTAIGERDRAEDKASTAERRRTRESEELKNKYRDIKRSLKITLEDKEELEIACREWKQRREELEIQSVQSVKELDRVRKAMGELREALDESEGQALDLEKQKSELRRSVEETQHRLEKLQKSNKVYDFQSFLST